MMVLRYKWSSLASLLVLPFLCIIILFMYFSSTCTKEKTGKEIKGIARIDNALMETREASEMAAFKKAIADSESLSIMESIESFEKALENRENDFQSAEKQEERSKPKLISKNADKSKVKLPSPQKATKVVAEKKKVKKFAEEQPEKEIKKEPKKVPEKRAKPSDIPGSATQTSPGNTYLLLGHTAFKGKDYRDATKYLKKALEEDENLFLAHYWLGRTYIERGKHSSAVEALENALATRADEDKEIDVEKYLAWEYVEDGQYDEAVDLYKGRIEKHPQDLESHFGLAFALKGAGQLNESAQAYRKAIEINPDIASIHYNLANTLTEVGQQEEAIEEYKKAIALNPNYGKAYFSLGLILEKEERWTEAIESYNKCFELGHKKFTAKRHIRSILKKREAALDQE